MSDVLTNVAIPSAALLCMAGASCHQYPSSAAARFGAVSLQTCLVTSRHHANAELLQLEPVCLSAPLQGLPASFFEYASAHCGRVSSSSHRYPRVHTSLCVHTAQSPSARLVPPLVLPLSHRRPRLTAGASRAGGTASQSRARRRCSSPSTSSTTCSSSWAAAPASSRPTSASFSHLQPPPPPKCTPARICVRAVHRICHGAQRTHIATWAAT
jgi:hypothetical protein